ncbi:aldo/keto reductase [Plastoroseomonas arctica]|uniref:Aldo/keto reductase n=1 Tax=Plastoroseomonas arctica TaxID=1509237 RepID=A0AAF1K073_9PROT|nr:aldo/keto reductase [Plastoroseomonas arctica]MBR0657391.1 aldo/keto reductase [Plastoroseomonas arctica]
MVPMIETKLLRMPKIGLGTWPMKGAECQAAVESAIAMGYRSIDTAEMYGNEAEVGAGIAASGIARDELFVTTKVWHDKLTKDGIAGAIAASLGKLKLDHVDLFHIHWPNAAMDLNEALGGLEAARSAGQARAVGVCNFPPKLFRRAIEAGVAPIACLQVEHHVYLDQTPLKAIAREHGIAFTCYSPTTKNAVAEDPVIRGIAQKHGATPVQIALAWLLRQDGVAAIPKAAGAMNQGANLGALSIELDEADVAAIDALPKKRRLVSPAFAPDWANG